MSSLSKSWGACPPCPHKLGPCLQICASLNYRKKIKADPSADSSKAFEVNRELSIVDIRRIIFRADVAA